VSTSITIIDPHAQLDELGAKVRDAVRQGDNHLRQALLYRLKVGRYLIEAKGLCLHGEWGAWMDRWWAKSERTAQMYMRFVGLVDEAGISATVADLPLLDEQWKLASRSGPELAMPDTAAGNGEGDTSAVRESSSPTLTPGPVTTAPPDKTAITRQQVYDYRFSMVSQMMDTGVLTPDQALVLGDTLSACAPKVRGDMLLSQIVDSGVIREMNRLWKAGRESYDELVASRYVQMDNDAIPLERATLRNLRDYLDEKRDEHRRAAIEQKRGRVTCSVGGDVMRRALRAHSDVWRDIPTDGRVIVTVEWEVGS
jgi:hypothetical protein